MAQPNRRRLRIGPAKNIKVYSRVTAETTPDLPSLLKNITTTASRYDAISYDWKDNLHLLHFIRVLKADIDDVNAKITISFLHPPPTSANLSHVSMAPSSFSLAPSMTSIAPSIHLYTTSSGQVVHTIDNAMDISLDFLVPQQLRAPSPLDAIMSDPDPDPAQILKQIERLQENIKKAERRLTLHPPLLPHRYNRYQEKIIEDLIGVVPAFYCLMINNRSLTIIMGLTHDFGWVMMVRTADPWRWPTESTKLVHICFLQGTTEHNRKLVYDLDHGKTLKTIDKKAGKIEDC